MTMRNEGHTKVSGPEWFVNSREVEAHLGKMSYCVVSWLESEISHLTKPKVHSLSSPSSIFTEYTSVSVNQRIERASTRRNIAIVHQILHYLLCHVHSSHLSRPTSDQQRVCHDRWTHSFVFLHLLEQVHCTIHVLQFDPALYECVVSTIVRSQSGCSHHFKK